MGTNSSTKQKYLTKTEIDAILNQKESLRFTFEKIKNADGNISLSELRTLTTGFIEDFILKKIIHFCGKKEGILSYNDFLYFYAILNTTSPKAKLNFILDFIFNFKDSILKEKYITRIKKYFSVKDILQKILLNEAMFFDFAHL